MKLSGDQRAAAHRLGQDVCVVAGPGSGKTRVLTERFAWLVTERGIAPNRILAITFTEKAATEIKARIVDLFKSNPQVREKIERAYVSTIHAFCARLLRENSIAAGIDPEFQVLDISQSKPLLSDTADDVLEQLYAADPERFRLFLRSMSVANYRGPYVPDLAGSLIEIYETLRVAGASVDDFQGPPPPYDALVARLLTIANAILADNPRPHTDKMRDQHAEGSEWARAVASLDWSSITAGHLQSLKRPHDKLALNSLVKGSALHAHEEEVRQLIPELRGTLVMHHYAAERATVGAALARIDALYRRRKRDRSALDFDDLEEAAIHLLEHQPEIRAQVQSSFDYILMDELQDTNPLQWKLMSLVRRDNNFFAVGDVNQSIYGFRHAQPDLFHQYRHGLKQAGREIDELRTNFRTRQDVLDAVNSVFRALPGVEPHTLIAGSDFCDKNLPSIETLTIEADSSDMGEEREARWVARRIVELVGNVAVVKGRPARFGDIAILVRANQSTGELQTALDEFRIPSIVLGGETFFETREIRDLKLLLDVLVNPCNEISLAGLLRSPMFGLADEEMLRLVAEHGTLAQAVRKEPPPFWNSIEELRAIRNLVSPDRLLQRVLDESDYTSGLTERARGNVEKFLTTLRERYHRAPRPLADIAGEVEQATPEAEAPPAEFGDAVRLMTLHKSKGLEFPIVFLPYLHKKSTHDLPVISYHPQNGLGIKWRDPITGEGLSDCVREANRRLEKPAREGEENRLLYVGMTRAMEHLVLSWTRTDRKTIGWAACIEPALGSDVKTSDPDPLEHDYTRDAELDIPVVDPARATALHDSATSVTDVSRFLECPRKYYLNRYLRWESRPRRLEEIDEDELDVDDYIDASELGTQVHALLAGDPVPSPDPEAERLAARFRESELGRLAASARTQEHEWDFVMDVFGVVVRGQVDLWFESGRDLIIVDYKTDHKKAPIDPESVRGYALQIQIYAEAIERATGKRPTRGVLHFLRPNITVDIDVSPLARAAALDVVHQLMTAQHNLDFTLREGEDCATCDQLCLAKTSTAFSPPKANEFDNA